MLPSYPVNRLFRYLKYKLLGRELIISGGCRQCGNCCRKINLCVDHAWISSPRKFKKLVKEDPDYERFRIVGRNRHGPLDFECTWLREDNTCGDYENRLDFCREFPNKEIFIKNGTLPEGCSYKAQEGVPFGKVLDKEMKKKR